MLLTWRTLIGTAIACGVGRAASAYTARPVVRLWPKRPSGGGGPVGPVAIDDEGALSNVTVPGMEVFVPERPNGAAMLVAAGGGYKRIQVEKDAHPAAHWLAAHGITAFVLAYRLPREGWRDGPWAPLQDAQRALRLIRANAERHGLSPDRIGVRGFSAGGHLMRLAATRSAARTYDPVDAADRASARPDTAALIYPVITLEPPHGRTSTRVPLIGRHPSPQESRDWSVETHVQAHCPPVFLVQAEDDPSPMSPIATSWRSRAGEPTSRSSATSSRREATASAWAVRERPAARGRTGTRRG
jgi:acetyl esterase/lipase